VDVGTDGPAPPVALYVHVPFCVSRCPYCDFVVYAGAAARGPRNRIDAFLSALDTELVLRADALDRRFGPPGTPARPSLRSVYLGGGTPSLLAADAIATLLRRVAERFGVDDDAEVTIEANPGRDERGDAAALARAGVTRLSLGAQRLDRAELRRLGRRHRPEDVSDAVVGARAAGIASIGLDLLYDIPGDSASAWASTLDAALALHPEHLSLYALTLDDPDGDGLTGPGGDHLPTSTGARRWRVEARTAQDEDRAAEAYEQASSRLAGAGFLGYEISNWSRPGHESRHNLAYWRRLPHEAVGPGAHAFDGRTRRWNAARFDAWAAALAPAPGTGRAPSLPPGGSERIGPDSARAEAVMLALRTAGGVAASAAGEPPLAGAYGWAVENGLLESTPADRLVLTTRGRLLSNELFARLA
jgi:oxygen-independent coproporphyrinogen-3 oxidase